MFQNSNIIVLELSAIVLELSAIAKGALINSRFRYLLLIIIVTPYPSYNRYLTVINANP
jgi:hypothetical protein